MLTTVIATESHELTTLAVVRAEFGLIGTAENERLALWISQASVAIQDYCKRAFLAETVTETFKLDRVTDGLYLARYPLISITSITEQDNALLPGEYEVNCVTGILTRLYGDRRYWWSPGRVTAAYRGGYETLDDVPSALRRAAVLLVKNYRLNAKGDSALRSEDVADLDAASHASNADAMPSEVTQILAPYCDRRVR